VLIKVTWEERQATVARELNPNAKRFTNIAGWSSENTTLPRNGSRPASDRLRLAKTDIEDRARESVLELHTFKVDWPTCVMK
jgi:hypothetical protein